MNWSHLLHPQCDRSFLTPVWVVSSTLECVFGKQFSSCGLQTPGVPETSAGHLWGQNFFHNNTRRYLLFAVLTLACKTNQHCWCLHQNNGIELYWPLTCSLPPRTRRRKKSQFYLRMSFEEAVRINNSVKSQPWMHVSLLFCVTKRKLAYSTSTAHQSTVVAMKSIHATIWAAC